jgi:hypothetical protein
MSRTKALGKSSYAFAVDEVQAALRPFLKDHDFKSRGRAFNRVTDDGLTQVIGIQMGPSDPPGTYVIPGFRENYHGLFTVNLGVYVPEVAKNTHGGKTGSWIQEYDCCVRARLGEAAGSERDMWWHARFDPIVVDDVRDLLETSGIPFLERFDTRDKILAEWHNRTENMGTSQPPRIVMAIILAGRDQKVRARTLLTQQALDNPTHGHPDYVQKLANKLTLGDLDI